MAWVLIPALCLLSGACAQDWSVTFGPGPLTGWVGSCVTIPCSFSHPLGWTVGAVSWTRDGAQTVYHSDGTRIHPAFVGRARYLGDLQGNCSLRVAGLRPSDQGTYLFWLEAEQEGEKEGWSSKSGQRLSVSAHPCQPSLGNRTEPGPALTCSVGAACSLRPSWYGPDGAGPSPDQTPSGAGATELRVSPSRLGPGAVLRCQVNGTRDECGSESEPPPGTGVPRVEVSRPAGQAVLREGDGFTLRCQAPALQPGAQYVWSRGAVWLPGARQELQVEKAAVSDGGSYACGAWVSGPDWGQLSLSARESVEVQYTPKGVRVTAAPGTCLREGESVTLRCNYSSSLPVPTSYAWYRGNQSLEGTQQELALRNITAEQAGEYRCQVTNRIGPSQSPFITITVQCAPKGVNVTATPKTGLCEGEPVNLTCHFNSSFPTNVTWYRDNVQLNESQSVLAYERVTGSHTGKYHCEVQNQGGTAHSAPVTVSVTVLFCIWEHIYIIGPAAAAVLLLLMGLVSIIVWSKKRSKHEGVHSNPHQSGPGEIPLAECSYENTQSHGMGKPACLAPPGPPSAPAQVCLGSPSDTEPSHIYSQLSDLGTVPQDDPDEVQYSVIQLRCPTQRMEPDADLTCEYSAIKR